MSLEFIVPISMFISLFICLLLGFPVAFTLPGVSIIFALIGYYSDLFWISDLGFIPQRIWGIMSNQTLVAVPLFIFMGVVLESSKIAEDLLKTMSRLLPKHQGSLASSVILVGTLLAASTGIVGATVVTMTLMSLPTMLAQGYRKDLACGTIAAAGTLGQIIPPSIILILLGSMMQVDVGDLFVAAIIPSLLLVSFYLVYIFIVTKFSKTDHEVHQKAELNDLTFIKVFKIFITPILLILFVLGSILFGIASPTEAAACGASGSLLITYSKGLLNKSILNSVMSKTARITAIIFAILIGAQFFSVVFRGLGGDLLIENYFLGWDLSRGKICFILMSIIFILGFFLDFIEICFIVIPIIYPIILKLNFSPLWFSIMLALNLQTSFLTPPFGFSLFYLKGSAPKEIRTGDIYRGVIPFIAIQLFLLVILAFYPDLVLWLPNKVFDK